MIQDTASTSLRTDIRWLVAVRSRSSLAAAAARAAARSCSPSPRARVLRRDLAVVQNGRQRHPARLGRRAVRGITRADRDWIDRGRRAATPTCRRRLDRAIDAFTVWTRTSSSTAASARLRPANGPSPAACPRRPLHDRSRDRPLPRRAARARAVRARRHSRRSCRPRDRRPRPEKGLVARPRRRPARRARARRPASTATRGRGRPSRTRRLRLHRRRRLRVQLQSDPQPLPARIRSSRRCERGSARRVAPSPIGRPCVIPFRCARRTARARRLHGPRTRVPGAGRAAAHRHTPARRPLPRLHFLPMRIAFDVSPLSHERTGVNNYIRGSLARPRRGRAERRHEIVAFAPTSPAGTARDPRGARRHRRRAAAACAARRARLAHGVVGARPAGRRALARAVRRAALHRLDVPAAARRRARDDDPRPRAAAPSASGRRGARARCTAASTATPRARATSCSPTPRSPPTTSSRRSASRASGSSSRIPAIGAEFTADGERPTSARRTC